MNTRKEIQVLLLIVYFVSSYKNLAHLSLAILDDKIRNHYVVLLLFDCERKPNILSNIDYYEKYNISKIGNDCMKRKALNLKHKIESAKTTLNQLTREANFLSFSKLIHKIKT